MNSKNDMMISKKNAEKIKRGLKTSRVKVIVVIVLVFSQYILFFLQGSCFEPKPAYWVIIAQSCRWTKVPKMNRLN
jgi:hypothetical protein